MYFPEVTIGLSKGNKRNILLKSNIRREITDEKIKEPDEKINVSFDDGYHRYSMYIESGSSGSRYV